MTLVNSSHDVNIKSHSVNIYHNVIILFSVQYKGFVLTRVYIAPYLEHLYSHDREHELQ